MRLRMKNLPRSNSRILHGRGGATGFLLYFLNVLYVLYLLNLEGFYDKRREKSGVGSDYLRGG